MSVNPDNVVLATEVMGEPCLMRWLPKRVSILGITYRVKRKRLPDGEDGYIVPLNEGRV